MKKGIIILWTEAIRLEDLNMSDYAHECGVYMVLVVRERSPDQKECIYVGKTTGTFAGRFAQHQKEMRHDRGHFLHCRERLYVRLGLIPRAVKDGDKQYGRIISHAEFVLISNLKPQYNRKPGTRIREFDGMPIINEDISETELIHIKAIL